jgi:hypothetical protein
MFWMLWHRLTSELLRTRLTFMFNWLKKKLLSFDSTVREHFDDVTFQVVALLFAGLANRKTKICLSNK